MIVLMCVIGAVTRLTESGLSITQWEPVRGVLPPLNAPAWDKAFQAYQETPQYHAINQGMSLAEFKHIYFWEWAHRLWGRLIGLVYALPLLFFWLTRKIPPGFKTPLLIGLGLGGLQGFVGWFMVQSGLEVGMVSVSPLRLAMHLMLALFIFCFLLWQILRLLDVPRDTSPLYRLCRLSLGLLAITICWGAFTAGLDAGKIYNSFPLMNGRLVPEDFLAMTPAWVNVFSNPAAVQFTHRVLATTTFVFFIILAFRLYQTQRLLAIVLGTLISVQFMLGVITVLTGAAIMPAALHQANAVLLLGAMVICVYRVKRPPAVAPAVQPPDAAT